MKKKTVTGALISIAIAELVGAVSALLAGNIKGVYQTLNQPPLAPPHWLFPIAWGILYALMGLAAYWVCTAKSEPVKIKAALTLYGAQLFVNFIWTIVFFRFQMFGTAIAVLVLLDILAAWTILKFYRISRPAVYMMLPYLVWILFATYLNIGIYLLN